jgi:hypothetical protein
VFTPLSNSAAYLLKNSGNIEFIISPGWDGRETCMEAPYSIIYSRDDTSIHSSIYLYHCSIMTGRTLAVDNITNTMTTLAKPLSYVFLEMTIDAIEKLANGNMSHKLIITASKVQSFDEVAFDKGFDIERSEAVEGLYKAIKHL